jgi:hypothetical protein
VRERKIFALVLINNFKSNFNLIKVSKKCVEREKKGGKRRRRRKRGKMIIMACSLIKSLPILIK